MSDPILDVLKRVQRETREEEALIESQLDALDAAVTGPALAKFFNGARTVHEALNGSRGDLAQSAAEVLMGQFDLDENIESAMTRTEQSLDVPLQGIGSHSDANDEIGSDRAFASDMEMLTDPQSLLSSERAHAAMDTYRAAYRAAGGELPEPDDQTPPASKGDYGEWKSSPFYRAEDDLDSPEYT